MPVIPAALSGGWYQGSGSGVQATAVARASTTIRRAATAPPAMTAEREPQVPVE